jgi:MraZ protein
LFIGQHHLAFDTESRLAVPARLREPLSSGVVITQGLDRNLWVMPDSAFQQVCRCIREMNLTDPNTRLLLRSILSHAQEVELDPSGNILISEMLRKYAGLNKDVVVVGQGDYLEIWDLAQWENQETLMSDIEANRERFTGLSIITCKM